MTEISQRYEAERKSANNQVKAIILETTTLCSSCACPGCYMIAGGRNVESPGLINASMAETIFDLVKQQNDGKEAESVDLIGGEPMEPSVWPEIKKTIDIALDRGITPWLFTNGMEMTPEIAKWLMDQGVFVTMKLNIGNPQDAKQLEVQAQMIGKTVAAAKQLVQGLYTALDAGLQAPQLSVENLIRGGNPTNVPFVPEYYELGLNMNFKPDIELMGNGEIANYGYFALTPTIEQIRWIMDQIKSVRERRGLEPITFLMPHVTGSCPFYDTALYFRPNGDIQPCSNNRIVLGNIFQDGITAISQAINNPVIQIRRNLQQSQINGPCGQCGLWSLCRGGCRATVESFGNPFGSYPLCGIQQQYDRAENIAKIGQNE